jgi:hypothetical protein
MGEDSATVKNVLSVGLQRVQLSLDVYHISPPFYSTPEANYLEKCTVLLLRPLRVRKILGRAFVQFARGFDGRAEVDIYSSTRSTSRSLVLALGIDTVSSRHMMMD